MTNIIRVSTKRLRVWRKEEVQRETVTFGMHIGLLVTIDRIYLIFRVNLSHLFFFWTRVNIKQLITNMHIIKIKFRMQRCVPDSYPTFFQKSLI